MEFLVVKSHADHCLYLFLCERNEAFIIIALVCSTNDPYYRSCLALKCIPCSIYICGFGVVDIKYITDTEYLFKSVLDSLEGRKSVSGILVVYIHDLRCDSCRHGIIYIVSSTKSKLLKEHVTFLLLVFYDHLVSLHKGALLDLTLLGKRKLLSLHDNLVEVVYCYLIVRTEDEAVVA